MLAPELVDQPVAGKRLVGVNEQERQQRPLLGAGEETARSSSRTSSGPRMRKSIPVVRAGRPHGRAVASARQASRYPALPGRGRGETSASQGRHPWRSKQQPANRAA